MRRAAALLTVLRNHSVPSGERPAAAQPELPSAGAMYPSSETDIFRSPAVAATSSVAAPAGTTASRPARRRLRLPECAVMSGPSRDDPVDVALKAYVNRCLELLRERCPAKEDTDLERGFSRWVEDPVMLVRGSAGLFHLTPDIWEAYRVCAPVSLRVFRPKGCLSTSTCSRLWRRTRLSGSA